MQKTIRDILFRSLPLLLSAAMAMIVFVQSAYNGSNMDTVPDSVEYAFAGYNLANSGTHNIVVDGRALPPRYSPWFSMTTIAPAYLICGNEPGNAIYPITLWAVLGVIAAFMLGYLVRLLQNSCGRGGTRPSSGRNEAGFECFGGSRSTATVLPGVLQEPLVAGQWSGALASFLLLSLPLYQFYGKRIMTDVPCATMAILACTVYVRLSNSNARSLPLTALAGIISALSAGYRPASAAILLPFVILTLRSCRKKQMFMHMTVLLIPILTVAGATMLYNALTFGSPLRNGYSFWCAVPYDYFKLTFNRSYITGNLRELMSSGFPLLALTTGVLFAAWQWQQSKKGLSAPKPNPIRHVLEFLLIGTVPTVLFHMVYFFHDDRFFLSFLAILAVLVGSLAGRWVCRLPTLALVSAQLAVLVLIGTARIMSDGQIPYRRREADRILRCTPDNAVIVSSIDPVYLEFLVCRSSSRRVIPLTRNVEYASKLLSPKKVESPVPPPYTWCDHRCEGLINAGAAEAISVVASEQPQALRLEMDKGNPVYLYTGMISESDALAALELQSEFISVPRAELLYELMPR